MESILQDPTGIEINAPNYDEKWDRRFLELAGVIASWSKDPSKKVGCVITGPEKQILATGFNGMPRNVNDNVDDRYETPTKYYYFEHAERNAVFNAARHGVCLRGCTAYSTFITCSDCARALIQSGIYRLVVPGIEETIGKTKWTESWTHAYTMLIESGMKIDFVGTEKDYEHTINQDREQHNRSDRKISGPQRELDGQRILWA